MTAGSFEGRSDSRVNMVLSSSIWKSGVLKNFYKQKDKIETFINLL